MAVADNVTSCSANEHTGTAEEEGSSGLREAVVVKVVGYQLATKDFNYTLEV